MNITEFAENRNIDRNAVSMYIRRHEKEFSGHIKQVGKTIELDNTALELLDKKYPLPAPVEVVEDRESREKLLLAQEYIIKLQQQLVELQGKAALVEAQQLLLEDREQQLAAEKQRSSELAEKLEIERAKTWWDKLRGR